jgi:hypothetical protein
MMKTKSKMFFAMLAIATLFATAITSCKAKHTHCAAYGSVNKPNNKIN